MSEVKNKTIEITEMAETNLSNMQQRVRLIGEYFGTDSVEYVKASETLTHSLLQIFRLGGKVTAEDELNLYCMSFITYGVVFSPNRTPMTTRFGDTVTGIAGEWSVHS